MKVKGVRENSRSSVARLHAACFGLNCAWFNAFFADQSIGSTMPTYDYSCQKCGQNFEAFQSMRDKPFRECPKELCRLPKWGHGKVKRLLGTGAGLIFKGSGFYTNDYRSDSYKEAAKKETPTPASGSDKPAAAPAGEKSSPGASTKTSEPKPKKESG